MSPQVSGPGPSAATTDVVWFDFAVTDRSLVSVAPFEPAPGLTASTDTGAVKFHAAIRTPPIVSSITPGFEQSDRGGVGRTIPPPGTSNRDQRLACGGFADWQRSTRCSNLNARSSQIEPMVTISTIVPGVGNSTIMPRTTSPHHNTRC